MNVHIQSTTSTRSTCLASLPRHVNTRMTPTLTHLPLPQESDVHFLHIISNLLSPAECAAIIHEHTTSLIPHELTLTSRLREIFDDEDLADTLWKRLKPFYGGMRIIDEDGCNWTASRLNTRFRFAKYERGRFTSIHSSLLFLRKLSELFGTS
jgi:hypothetical protein